jgi:hypothetical protein
MAWTAGPSGRPLGPDPGHAPAAPWLGARWPGCFGPDKGLSHTEHVGRENPHRPLHGGGTQCRTTLLSHALQTNRGTSVEISVPGSGLTHELFREFGFVGGANRLRMKLGDAARAKGLEIYGTTPYLAT